MTKPPLPSSEQPSQSQTIADTVSGRSLSAPDQAEPPASSDSAKSDKRGGLFPEMFPPALEPPHHSTTQYKAAKSIGRFIKTKTPPRSDGVQLASATALADVVHALLARSGPMTNKLTESQTQFDSDDPMITFSRTVCDISELMLPVVHQFTWTNMAQIDWVSMSEIRCELSDLSVCLKPYDIRLEPIHRLEWLLRDVITNACQVLKIP